MNALPEGIEAVLIEVAGRFTRAGVAYEVGGSAMLRLAGFDVDVGDVDFVVPAEASGPVRQALADCVLVEPVSAEPWRTRWLLNARLPAHRGIGIDVMGGLALVIDGEVAVFPFQVGERGAVGELQVPLASLPHWYHLYRVHAPQKAALVAGRLSDDEIMAAAADLHVAHLFSPTLIVRIGNETDQP